MGSEVTFTQKQLDAALQKIARDDTAKLLQSNESPVTEIYSEVFDLSVAVAQNAPKIISYPAKGLLIRDASDSNANINFLFDNRNGLNGAGAVLKKNSVWNNPSPLSQVVFWWAAQGAGKTVTVELYRRGQILPGNFTTSISQVFSSVEATPAVAMVTSTAAVLLAADTDRKRAYIQNQGNVPIYLGSSVVTGKSGTNPGQAVAAGLSFTFDNTAALYAITDSTSNANIAIQVFK